MLLAAVSIIFKNNFEQIKTFCNNTFYEGYNTHYLIIIIGFLIGWYGSIFYDIKRDMIKNKEITKKEIKKEIKVERYLK